MSRQSRTSESAEGICPLCSENISIFAMGMCDHPVCYSCSTRMRVLCGQTQCAICRVEMPEVVFMKHHAKYDEVNTANFSVFRKHKIYFETKEIEKAFYALLDHYCPICPDKKKFRIFSTLRDHMRKEHSLFYCDICVNHLKVFSHERKYYDRTKLGLHRRRGDEDDKSHKGHPLCQFCDERFLDNDELVRHLRKEHYFCHFCDSDGITNQFYSEYSYLREHFRESHHLCLEGDCINAEFTNAFRDEIDLKAHIAVDHSNKLRRAQARQARTIEIDFNLVPRPGAGRRERDRDRDWDRDRDRDRERGRGNRNRQTAGGVITGQDYEEVNQDGSRRGNYGAPKALDREAEDTARAISASLASAASLPQSKDFPSLDGRSSSPEPKPQPVKTKDPAQQIPDNMAMHVARSNNFSIADGSMDEEDFPSLGGSKNSKGSRQSNQEAPGAWGFKPTSKDFPALGGAKGSGGRRNSGPAQKQAPQPSVSWQPKSTPKSAPKTTTAPTVRTETVNVHNPGDFPSLSSIGSRLQSSAKVHSKKKVQQYDDDKEDYPALGGSQKLKQSSGQHHTKGSGQTAPPSQAKQTKKPKSVEDQFDEEFPSLGGKSSQKQPSSTAPQAATGIASAKKSNAEAVAMKKLQNQMKKAERDNSNLQQHEKATQNKTVHDRKLADAPAQESPGRTKKEEKITDSKKQSRKAQHAENKTVKTSEEKPKPEQSRVLMASPQTVQDKPQDKKKQQQKVDRFEDDFPSLGGVSYDTNASSVTKRWGPGEKRTDLKESGDDSDSSAKDVKQKEKKKNKSKEKKNDKNRQKVESEPDPTWGYIPDFVPPPPQPKKEKQPPSIVFKEDKENSRDKSQPWGPPPTPPNADYPTLFKVATEDFPGLNGNSALKDQSNITLASVSANLKGPTQPPSKSAVPNVAEEFPALSLSLPSPPPGLGFSAPTSKPPPGFDTLSSKTAVPGPTGISSSIPPPGFSNVMPETMSDAPKQDVDSLHKQTPVQPPPGLAPLEYTKPQNFMTRNTDLITAVKKQLGDDCAKFTDFKSCSGQFRQGKISGSEYYKQCMGLLGSDSFCEIFSELLALLPDVDKQQELLAAHREARQPQRGLQTKREKMQRKAWATLDNTFSTCSVCRQVLVANDANAHRKEHNLDAEFPNLPDTPANKYGFSAWVKSN